MTEHPDTANREAGMAALRNTVFGQVVCELLEKRGLPVSPVTVGALAEDAGLDGWAFINRMADADATFPGGLDGLDTELDLTAPEMWTLAQAFVFERRDPHPSDHQFLRRLAGD